MPGPILSTRCLKRREFVCALTVSVAAVSTGCGHLQQQSALDASLEDLQRVIADAAGAEGLQLCEQIGQTARGMLDTQSLFLRRFNQWSADASVEEQALVALATEHQSGIAAQRNHLLHLQDLLYQQIPAEKWPEVRDQLLS